MSSTTADTNELHLVSAGPSDTDRIAMTLAPLLHNGDAILLDGGLAVGKTHFVKALARALGSDDAVTSPTFGLAHFYTRPGGRLIHVDAYRLSGVAEYRDIGLSDYYDESITVVEWGDIVKADFTHPLTLRISNAAAGETAREIVVSATNPRWNPTIAALQTALGDLRK